MTMHLEGPWLSKIGKRKGKQKFRSSKEAKMSRELEESWKSLQKKWGVEQEEKKRQQALKAKPFSGPYLTIPEGRSTKHIPSLNGGLDMSPAVLKPRPVYTGTEMIGIGQLHKSNGIPIFKKQDAEDLAKMRR